MPSRCKPALRYAEYYLAALRHSNELYMNGHEDLLNGLRQFDEEWINIQKAQTWAVAVSEKDSEAAKICVEFSYAGPNCIELRQPLDKRIEWHETAWNALQHLKKYQAAKQQGAPIVLQEGAHSGEGYVFTNLGSAYLDQGETHKAIEFFEKALEINRKFGDRDGEGDVLGRLGNACHLLGQSHRAIDLLEKELDIKREVGNRRSEGNTLIILATVYIELGQHNIETEQRAGTIGFFESNQPYYSDPYHRAIELLELALDATREVGNRRSEGSALGELGNAYFLLGQYDLAIKNHEESLAIKTEIKDERSVGNTLGNLGVAYSALGKTNKAIEFYEKHLKIARKVGDRRGEVNALFNISQAQDKLGNHIQAITCAKTIFNIIEQAKSPLITEIRVTKLRDQLAWWQLRVKNEVPKHGEATRLVKMGTSYNQQGECEQAINYFEQALTISREIGDRILEGDILNEMGIAHKNLGEPNRAIEFYQQQLVITREIYDRIGESNALGNLGIAYKNMRRFHRAIEFYRQQLDIAHEIAYLEGEGNAMGNLGAAYAGLGDLHRAIEFYQQQLVIARKTHNHIGEGNSLFNTSLALKELGENIQAISHAQDALKVYERIKSPNVTIVQRHLATWRLLVDINPEPGKITKKWWQSWKR